jgi:hypothetical protein
MAKSAREPVFRFQTLGLAITHGAHHEIAAAPAPLLPTAPRCRDPSAFGRWAQRSEESGMGTTSICTPVSTFVRWWPCITTAAPILQFFAFNNSEEEMCQHVPSASVAMPPLFIALRVLFFDAIFDAAGRAAAPAARCKD